MADGILIIDKPADWTSMDVCAKLRGVFREKRIGHGGTLDPMATGVLPVFLGRATRAVAFSTDSDKEYIARLQLGVITNTQDTTGEVLERRPVSVTPEALEAVLERFRGELDQIPPMYSAIKIGGKKLYELARKGQEVEREPRHIVIRSLTAAPTDDSAVWDLTVRCSKGTYVRTLCHDIGLALGCGGAMAALRRTCAGGFSLADAVPLADVLAHPDPLSLLRPVDSCFAAYPAYLLPPDAEKRVRNGAAARVALPDGLCRVYGGDGSFLALAVCRGGDLMTIKSFF